MTQARILLGARGEELAAKCYEQEGWKILARNWRCKQGELDIIAQKYDGLSKTPELVFCEVKTRSNFNFGSPGEAVTLQKQKRIRKLASIWLSQRHFKEFSEIRFDVAEVMNEEVEIYSYF